MSVSHQLTIPAGVEFFRKRMSIEPGLAFESWFDLGRYLGEMRRSVNFWQAGHLRYGREAYGEERVELALKQMSFEFEDVKAMESLLKLETGAHAELTAEHHFVAVKRCADATEQERWLATAEKEKLSPMELRKSIIAGVVVRDEKEEKRAAGVPSPFAVRQQFDLWQREIVDRWEALSPEELEAIHGLLRPVADFVARLELKMAAGEEARAPFNDPKRVMEKIRFHFALGAEVSIAKIQRKLRVGYNAASVAFDAMVESGEVSKGIRVNDQDQVRHESAAPQHD